MIPSSRRVALVAAVSILAAHARADGVQVVIYGAFVESVRVGSYVVPAAKLGTGHSSGEVSFVNVGSPSTRAADDRNLGVYFARTTVRPDWLVALDSWSDTNGVLPDFFLFEVGGDDEITVAPRFTDGSVGRDIAIDGWTSTGYAAPVGPNKGQLVYGLSFAHGDLRYADGTRLQPDEELTGLLFRSASVDGAAFLFVDPAPADQADGDASVSIHGVPQTYCPLELEYQGLWKSSTAPSPNNPFLDHRLQVRFEGPGGLVFAVPGFFDGDGAGGKLGRVWRARFTPPAPGAWRAVASFRLGPNVAIDLDPGAGSPGLLDGVETTFDVAEASIFAPGFLCSGRPMWEDEHYRRFETGGHYLKGGANSPENFLAFRGFDSVVDAGGVGILHGYGPHVSDWKSGDPLFQSDVHDTDSRGIIGALNYLGAQEVNSLFALVMNLGGDGQDVHPFVGPEKTPFDKTHYDVGRLGQWNEVFGHAMRQGIALQLGLGETEPENESWLDGGFLGIERKLFYRELVARFAHHPALQWVLCEENDYSITNLRQFADWIDAQDAYDHPISFHNRPNDFSDFLAVVGDSRFAGTSLQFDPELLSGQIETMRSLSGLAGHPWIVEANESTPWNEGLTDTNADEMRRRVLYDAYFSGGGVEWYMGWHDLPLGGDLTLENFRTREDMWRMMRVARHFVAEHLPYWEMQPADLLLLGESTAFGGGEVFVLPGRIYAIYLPDASPSGLLDLLLVPGLFTQRWFDPRTGAFAGLPRTVVGGGLLGLGPPPSDPQLDWVVLIENQEDSLDDLFADVDEISVSQGGRQKLHLVAGSAQAGRTYLVLGSLTGTQPGMQIGGVHLPLNPDRYMRYAWEHPSQGFLIDTLGTLDANGEAFARIRVTAGPFGALVGTTLHHAYLLIDPAVDYASIAVPLRLLP